MPILHGAVAYRIDVIPKFESEIKRWEGIKPEPINFQCPGNAGNPCDVQYRLLVEKETSDDRIAEYLADAQQGLQGYCPEEHAFRISMKGGPREGKLTSLYVYSIIATL